MLQLSSLTKTKTREIVFLDQSHNFHNFCITIFNADFQILKHRQPLTTLKFFTTRHPPTACVRSCRIQQKKISENVINIIKNPSKLSMGEMQLAGDNKIIYPLIIKY